MKKLLLALTSIFLISSVTFAQGDTEQDMQLYGTGTMPFNDAGEVVFSQVIPAEGHSVDDIYTAAKIYITEAFRSANDVIQMDDKDNGILIIKGWREQTPQSGFMRAFAGAPYQVHFTMKIQARDGRYKVDIYQLRGHQDAHYVSGQLFQATDVPAENLTDDVCIKPNGKVKTAGSGFWRRLVMDGARAMLSQAENKINDTLNGEVSSASTEEDW